MKSLLPFVLLSACSSAVLAQAGLCAFGLNTAYEGPCYYGALPAFFDDFAYASARTTTPVADAPRGDLFGLNDWMTREGTERTRAWYRFNRGDLPVPGSITFEQPSTMVLTLPQGLDKADYPRDLVVSTEFAADVGTYAWRVRLSELWEGQSVRHAVWTHSNSSYVFERLTPTDTLRTAYWSELDFENENHFTGERRGGVFVPDYVTRMSVGNHYGSLEYPGYSQRLGRAGATEGAKGRGKLARNGSGSAPETAPLITSWADVWLYFLIEVDTTSRSVSYRMIPEQPQGGLQALGDISFTVGPEFFPLYPTHPALSLHWLDSEGRLQRPLYMEVDWLYYTPRIGLSAEDIRRQVGHFQERGITRLNTTGTSTFEGYRDSQPIRLTIGGPREVACGEEATWKVKVQRIGRYFTTYRYRILRHDGAYGPWNDVLAPTLTLTPQPGQSGVEMEASAQDLWAPYGVVKGPTGWSYPNARNAQERAQLSARFVCGRP